MGLLTLCTRTEPSNPPAGKERVWIDSVDKRLKKKDENGLITQFFGNLLKNYINGLKLSFNSITAIDIAPGVALDDGNVDLIELNATISIDLTADLDTGVEAANTWYFVWLFKNPTTQAIEAKFSASSTAPTATAGFTLKRLLGSVRNNVSSNLLNFTMTGSNNDRYIEYNENIAFQAVLFAGLDAAFTDVDCSAVIAPISTEGNFSVITATSIGIVRPNGSAGTGNISQATDTQVLRMTTDSNQVIEYLINAGGAMTIVVVGYFLEI